MKKKNILSRILEWFATRKSIKHFMGGLSSLRRLWCWIFMILFIVLSTYIVLNNPEAHTTALTVWGTLVGTIFTGYVISSTTERIKDKQLKVEKKKIEASPFMETE